MSSETGRKKTARMSAVRLQLYFDLAIFNNSWIGFDMAGRIVHTMPRFNVIFPPMPRTGHGLSVQFTFT
jgi:hypothetical protein